MFGRTPQTIPNLTTIHDPFYRQPLSSFVDPYHGSSTNTKNLFSNNILLNRILEKHDLSNQPMEINARNFYSHLNLMTIKWTQSLSQRKLTFYFIKFTKRFFFLQKINASSFSSFFRRQFLF